MGSAPYCDGEEERETSPLSDRQAAERSFGAFNGINQAGTREPEPIFSLPPEGAFKITAERTARLRGQLITPRKGPFSGEDSRARDTKNHSEVRVGTVRMPVE